MAFSLGAITLWILTLGSVFLSLLYVARVQLVGFLGRLVGKHLESKTQSRRETILQQAGEESARQPLQHEKRKSEDLDWEKVEGKAKPQAEEEKAQKQQSIPDPGWDGIIGFFHPFWYRNCKFKSRDNPLTLELAMLAEAEKECFGPPFARRNKNGRMLSAWYIPGTMMSVRNRSWSG